MWTSEALSSSASQVQWVEEEWLIVGQGKDKHESRAGTKFRTNCTESTIPYAGGILCSCYKLLMAASNNSDSTGHKVLSVLCSL